jgi:hypothetical protein
MILCLSRNPLWLANAIKLFVACFETKEQKSFFFLFVLTWRRQSLKKPEVDVIITIFGDFRQFEEKKISAIKNSLRRKKISKKKCCCQNLY